MATFVFTVTCLLCFFTCCLSDQVSGVSCSVQYIKVCNLTTLTDTEKNPTLTDTEKNLCIYVLNRTQLLCNKMGYIPTFQKNSSLSTVELCKQIEVNNVRIDNFLVSCIRTCNTSSFMPVCLYLKNVINALINKTQSTVEKSPPSENKKVSTTKSMPTVTTSTNLTKNSKQLNIIDSSSITTVSIKSEINTNTSNASSDNSKLKSLTTSNMLKTDVNLVGNSANNVPKKTTDINLVGNSANNVPKKTTDINLVGNSANNVPKKATDINLVGNSVDDRPHDFEISKSFPAQKEIPNHFPTTSKDEQQKSFDVTNDRNAKQKTLLPAEYNETPSSAHFMGYFLTAIVLCIAGYIVFHNKQKIIAFIIEGRNQKRSRRPNSGEYKKLQTNVDDVMSSLEKSTASQNYIY